jgi:TRAP-type C4-dicarboxylate transport system permease small subunit
MGVLKSIVRGFYKALDAILVFCMAVMFVLIFVNVVMRFGFNSGIDISEEVPRFMFVWMTFFGAVTAMRERTHIGVGIVVMLLPRCGKQACYAICQVLIAICSAYMLYSTYLQHEIIYYNESPVLEVSMFWVFGVSYIAAPAIGINALVNLIRLACGQVGDAELILQSEEATAEQKAGQIMEENEKRSAP